MKLRLDIRGFLLDTNIVIEMMQGNEVVLDTLDRIEEIMTPDRFYISTITTTELVTGAVPGSEQLTYEFIRGTHQIPIDVRVAMVAGDFRRKMRNQGVKCKTPDALICTTAKVHELILVTNDLKLIKFARRMGVECFNPLDSTEEEGPITLGDTLEGDGPSSA